MCEPLQIEAVWFVHCAAAGLGSETSNPPVVLVDLHRTPHEFLVLEGAKSEVIRAI